jgi:hypothetical protein
MGTFINGFDERTSMDTTENDGLCYRSSGGGALLDFFAIVGGMRKRNEADIVQMYHAAREEDKELADKIILYVSNIREGGLGERRIGRILLKALAFLDRYKVERNFQTFVTNSRFDCLYALEGTPAETAMWQFMKDTLLKDAAAMKAGKPISLAAKWMKSINTSSAESKRLARKFCTVAGISERTYRKTLAALRKYSNVVEVKMSANEWEDINFEAVPSIAMKRYSTAFGEHCPNAFTQYKRELTTGEAKVNAQTLYPYDITYQFMYGGNADKDILEAQWKALPNYFKEGRNVVCCADVSSSMMGMPMAASIGLAMYCARYNTGAYNGYYLTFTDIPRFFKLDEFASIESNIKKVMRKVGYNTNLDGALKEIFRVATMENDAPEALLIVSDSEIDQFMSNNPYWEDIVQKWVRKYREVGLECPKIIFWNVEARQNTYLSKATNPYVGFVSGCSAGTFANLSQLIDLTSYEAMKAILDQYEFI